MATSSANEVTMPERDIQLLPASEFTIDELTAAYNQTRVDYLVPMPMNAARLAAYVQTYDVSLDHSLVAMDGEQILGLGMLGVRPEHTWATRLGVLPVRRRRGAGEAIMRALLETSRRLGAQRVVLEVIKGNQPAHQLFRKLGFCETRELIILRRPPGMPPLSPLGRATWLEAPAALERLKEISCCCGPHSCPAWTNEIESLSNVQDVLGLEVDLGAGGSGCLIFRRQKFLLSHFIFHTDWGPAENGASALGASALGASALVANALVAHLYYRFPHIDTYTENLSTGDPHLARLLQLGFMEVFRRIEMVCPLE